ncbi:MAG: hypothetical protein Q9165_007063 [Trypethelium subeluteriae]
MATPLNHSDTTSSAPYFQPIRGNLYHDGQDSEATVAINAPIYPDLPDAVNDESGQQPNDHHHFVNSDQLARLLRVANSVAAQEAVNQALKNEELTSAENRGEAHGKSKRKRGLTPPDGHNGKESHQSKRQKQTPAPSTSQAAVLPPSKRGPVNGESGTASPSRGLQFSEPRPPGIHTTAALFRPPNQPSSKKSTRPPISKLFSSLELGPSTFLELQSAAKAYMLDPGYPDRQDCVGNRGKGDSDVVKLRLYNCVREFLEEEADGPDAEDTCLGGRSRGDVFFGPYVRKEDGGERKWTWPKDRERVVGMCVPLLRRMVTNERQRKYAVETRSQVKTDGGVNTKTNVDTAPVAGENAKEPSMADAPTYQIYVQDPGTLALMRPRVDIRHSSPLTFDKVTSHVRQIFEPINDAPTNEVPANEGRPSVDETQSEASQLLQQEAQRALAVECDVSGTSHDAGFDILVQTSAGLKAVDGQETWTTLVEDVLGCPWFEHLVKVIVRTRERSRATE